MKFVGRKMRREKVVYSFRSVTYWVLLWLSDIIIPFTIVNRMELCHRVQLNGSLPAAATQSVRFRCVYLSFITIKLKYWRALSRPHSKLSSWFLTKTEFNLQHFPSNSVIYGCHSRTHFLFVQPLLIGIITCGCSPLNRSWPGLWWGCFILQLLLLLRMLIIKYNHRFKRITDYFRTRWKLKLRHNPLHFYFLYCASIRIILATHN